MAACSTTDSLNLATAGGDLVMAGFGNAIRWGDRTALGHAAQLNAMRPCKPLLRPCVVWE